MKDLLGLAHFLELAGAHDRNARGDLRHHRRISVRGMSSIRANDVAVTQSLSSHGKPAAKLAGNGQMCVRETCFFEKPISKSAYRKKI
jgi:hypothetical protein